MATDPIATACWPPKVFFGLFGPHLTRPADLFPKNGSVRSCGTVFSWNASAQIPGGRPYLSGQFGRT